MLVIGNGESRKHINVDAINDTKVGCNAIMRDYHVDHLVCADRRMVKEAIDCNYNKRSKVYTRDDYYQGYPNTKNLLVVPDLPYSGEQKQDDPFHWGSGPYAVLLACKLSDDIHMIGFDLHSKDGKTNNVYKDTTSYNTADKTAVDPRYWIYQINKCMSLFDARFIVYAEEEWQVPQAWKKPNVFIDKISNL